MGKRDFLKDRAERFFKNALELFNRGEYDLSAFNLEQVSQLFLKYAIWKRLGDFEKTYEISRLLKDYREIVEFKEDIDRLLRDYNETIADLEMAYIESRYLPSTFFKSQVERMIDFVKELREVIK